MAKHIVKCSICGEQFDANVIPYSKTSTTRYAHRYCFLNQEEKKPQEVKDKEELEAYIQKLFDYEGRLPPRIYQLFAEYVRDYKFTYKGMTRALAYFYEVKGNTVDKANKSIGIIPYCYKEAQDYYLALWEAQQKNSEKDIDKYKPQVVEVVIPPPARKTIKRNLFSFLDED